MEAEYRRRHDEIWPELVALLKEAGVSDYSIHLDRETNTLFGVLWRTRRSPHGRPAEPSGDEALVGAHGRHHGDEARQRAGRGAARTPSSTWNSAAGRRRSDLDAAHSRIVERPHVQRGRDAHGRDLQFVVARRQVVVVDAVGVAHIAEADVGADRVAPAAAGEVADAPCRRGGSSRGPTAGPPGSSTVKVISRFVSGEFAALSPPRRGRGTASPTSASPPSRARPRTDCRSA